jgi:hypothetical protein
VRRVGGAALLALVLAASAFAGFTVVRGVEPTRAAWTSARTVEATATAATPAAVSNVKCGAGSGLLNAMIPITWSAPAGPPPTRYRITWSGGAGSDTKYSTTTSYAIDASGISVAGTSTVRVFAEYGDWVSPNPANTVSFTTIAVLVVVSWTCSPFP